MKYIVSKVSFQKQCDKRSEGNQTQDLDFQIYTDNIRVKVKDFGEGVDRMWCSQDV